MLDDYRSPDGSFGRPGPAAGGAAGAIRFCLTSDGHGTDTLRNVRYAVATARRAWLTRDQVANTRDWPKLDKLRKRTKPK